MLNLLYCGNDRVFDGVMLSLLSIMKYNKKPLNVYIMTMDLTEEDADNVPVSQEMADYLSNMVREVNSESTVTLIDITETFKKDMKDGVNIKSSYTPYTLVRLYADQIDGMPDKILYLDTDTLAHDDIEKIYDTDLTGYEFAGVSDYLGRIFIRYDYMNAGVMLLNLPRIRATGVFRKARYMCKNKKMAFPDQTALNKCVHRKLFIPRKYNEQRKLKDDTVIQHFCKSIRWIPYFHTVNFKPWNVEEMHRVYKLHAYDDILNEYRRRKEDL